MTEPDNAFLARRLKEMQSQNREHFYILRAEIVRTQEGIERIERRLSSLEGSLFAHAERLDELEEKG